MKPTALVGGVGGNPGLGAALAKKFSSEGLSVTVCGRSRAKLDAIVDEIVESGGEAIAIECDTTKEKSVNEMFDLIERSSGNAPELVVYNAGNSVSGKIADMDSDTFVNAWKVLCLGGFYVGRECARRMKSGGTLIYTGASASLRGKAGFGAFNSGKSALRTLSQSLAKECGPDGLHVAHVIIDGGIAGQRQFDRMSESVTEDVRRRLIDLESLADVYWMLHNQSATGWTFELDLRTSIESW
ncbi:MAG: SDR family oxidoreductase [Pseudomonadota bacterium]